MKRKEPGMSGFGLILITVGALIGLGAWLFGIFLLPNSTTHENMSKLPAVMMYQGSSSSASSSTGNSSSGSSSGSSQSASGLPFPTSNPSNTKVMDVSATGYTIFENNCSGCHGQNLEGGFGPKLLGIGNVAKAAQLQAFITTGKGSMPAGGGLTDPKQIATVAAFLAKQTQK